jgi:hypothetical protein
MKNITLSADEHLIEAARARAAAENTTLNAAFRLWLENYAERQKRVEKVDALLKKMRGTLVVGRKLSRDEMNER